jgi:GntR family transcriptional regulator / MocR family aminotransferase
MEQLMPIKSALTLSLDRSRPDSLQQQIGLGLKQRIQAGKVIAGAPLPSSRELARDLGVSRNTVLAAYDQLIGEGYLESRPRSGIFVCSELTKSASFNERQVNPERRIQPSDRNSNAVIVRPIPFRPCQPDVTLFPMDAWNRSRNRAIRRHGPGLLDYQSQFALGLPALRRELAEYLSASRGVRCTWEQIAITSGSQQAAYLLCQLLLKRGDRVLQENPGYPGIYSACTRAGACIRCMQVDQHGAIPPVKPTSFKLIYTTPSRQFPTGSCLPVARRLAMIEYAKLSKAWLLEDDYDSEFRYSRPPFPSMHSLDDSGHVIYIGSMSKVLFPSLRIGYVVLPSELVQPFEALRLVVDDHGPLLDQATLADFMAAGKFFTHIRRCRKAYAAKLETFLGAAFQLHLPLSFPYIDGGMNQTGFFNESKTDDEAISQSLLAIGLFIPSLTRYRHKKSPQTPPGLVFGFTAFDTKTIKSSMSIVAQVLRDQIA